MAQERLQSLLAEVYDEPERTVVISEILHAIIGHRRRGEPYTVEAGVVRVADALDMAEGRSRIPVEGGTYGIHALSAAAIDKVNIEAGEERPVKIEIEMNNSGASSRSTTCSPRSCAGRRWRATSRWSPRSRARPRSACCPRSGSRRKSTAAGEGGSPAEARAKRRRYRSGSQPSNWIEGPTPTARRLRGPPPRWEELPPRRLPVAKADYQPNPLAPRPLGR